MGERASTRERIMETAMRMTALYGLSGFSMKQVTKEVGVTESLLYKYFDTRENLLLQCYLSVRERIGESLLSFLALPGEGRDAGERIRQVWEGLFKVLVENDYRTIYCLDYQDAPAFGRFFDPEEDEESLRVRDALAAWLRELGLEESEELGRARDWGLEMTGFFARKAIRGEIPLDEKSAGEIYRFIRGGLSALLEEARGEEVSA